MKRREEGEADVKRTEKILRRLERCERRKRGRDVEGCEGDQDLGEVRSEDEVFEIVDVAEDAKNDEEMAVNEEDRLDSGGGGGAGDDDEWGVGDEDWGSWGKDELDPGLVKAGRREEVEYMVRTLGMFEFGSLEEAWARGGKRPTTTKWVEGWKCDERGERFVRSRLVGRDFKPRHEEPRDDLYASMPPLEAKRVLFRIVAGMRGQRRRKGGEEVKLMFLDVRKAHLNAECNEEEWVELPEEFWEWGKYARLRRWLYGMRKAAAGWEENYVSRLVGEGFRRGIGAPSVFYNARSGVRVVVHGDDFTFAGTRRELESARDMMRGWYDIKDRGIMGSDQGEIKEVEILGRRLRWMEQGIEYEGDRKHRESLLEEEGLDDRANAVVSPTERAEGRGLIDDDVELGVEERRRFRSSAAKLNYLGQDRSDVQYAARGICSEMARPTRGGVRKLKRAVRYLLGVERVVWRMGEWDDGEEVKVEVYVDSDWAKEATRKSTSGGMLTVGGVGVKHWSRTQSSRALSVGEAEYYALVSGCKEGMGMQSLLRDLGWEADVVIWSDSSTAKGIAARRGLGKMRHVELRYLWVQEAVRRGRVRLEKVRGTENPADHLTKGKAVWEFRDLLGRVGGEMMGRACEGRWRGIRGSSEGPDESGVDAGGDEDVAEVEQGGWRKWQGGKGCGGGSRGTGGRRVSGSRGYVGEWGWGVSGGGLVRSQGGKGGRATCGS